MDVTAWLRGLGLERYAEAFRSNEIDFDLLPELSEADLEKLGLPLGPRKRLLKAISALAAARPETPAPATVPPPHEAAERRQLTVMFCDLVGSTALSARLDPEDLRALIDAYHGACAAAVERFGGRVAQYLGDGVMAYFGAPHAHEDDAERAVRAGLAVLDGVARLPAAETLEVRIGIATGLVVTAEVGAGAAQLHGALGETPNLAARMQALAEPGSIAIDQRTRRLIGDLFEYRDLGAVAVKGFDAPVAAFAVLRASTYRSRFEAMRGGGLTPLVGREEEVELLVRRWRQAQDGEGQVVLLSGEPGIGKSRLVAALLERIGAAPHLRLRYFCSAHHQDSALYPVIAQLERAAAFRREDNAAERLAKLETVLAQGSAGFRDDLPLVAALLSIPTGERYRLPDLSPQKRRERTLQAFLTQLEGLSGRHPLLVVFEDLHWADPTTRDLLDLLVERSATLPVLLLLSFRPEFSPPWVGQPQVSLLSLNRLSPRQRAQMIERVTGGKALPRELADQIAARTDGVPLFVEELTKSVLESGMVIAHGDTYAMTGAAVPMAIPATLQASLMARLDRLAPVREVAQLGAALGRQFSHELIAAVSDLPPAQLAAALDQLVGAELINRRGQATEAEYTFKHALVQDAAYESLLKSRRQQLHAQIAAVLEERFPETVRSEPERIAHHATEAGLAERASGFWLKAAAAAAGRSAMKEALTHARRGLELVATLPKNLGRWQIELGLETMLGQALLATRGFAAPEVGAAFERAHGICDQLGDNQKLVAIVNGQVFYHIARAELDRARILSDEVRERGRAQNDHITAALGDYMLGRVCFMAGDFLTGNACLDEGLRLYDPARRPLPGALGADDPHIMMQAFHAGILAFLGYIDRARALRKELFANARRPGQSFSLSYALIQSAGADTLCGFGDDIAERAKEASTLAVEHGYPAFLMMAQVVGGTALCENDHEEEGLILLKEGVPAMLRIGGPLWRPFGLLNQAYREAKESQSAIALERIFEVLDAIEKTGVRWVESEAYRMQGMLHHASGDFVAAEESFTQSIAVARSQSAMTFELRAAISLARLWHEQGKSVEARTLLAPVYAWFTEGLDTKPLRQAKTLLSQLQ